MEIATIIKPFVEMGLGVASFVALLLLVFRDVKDLKGELKGQTQVLREIKNELRAARGAAAHPTPGEALWGKSSAEGEIPRKARAKKPALAKLIPILSEVKRNG